MAKEMGKSTDEKLQSLSEEVQSLHKDIRLLKDSVQGVSIASLYIMHDMAHLHCRLGHCDHKVIKEPTYSSSSPTGKHGGEDDAHG